MTKYELYYLMDTEEEDTLTFWDEEEAEIEYRDITSAPECVAACLTAFYVYGGMCQGEQEIAKYTRPRETDKHTPFTDDREKINDLLHLSQDEFLKSYSYLTPEEYALTIIDIMARLFPSK